LFPELFDAPDVDVGSFSDHFGMSGQ
jgi:hypothetical protein